MEQYSEEFPKQKTVKRMFVRTLNLIKELYSGHAKDSLEESDRLLFAVRGLC